MQIKESLVESAAAFAGAGELHRRTDARAAHRERLLALRAARLARLREGEPAGGDAGAAALAAALAAIAEPDAADGGTGMERRTPPDPDRSGAAAAGRGMPTAIPGMRVPGTGAAASGGAEGDASALEAFLRALTGEGAPITEPAAARLIEPSPAEIVPFQRAEVRSARSDLERLPGLGDGIGPGILAALGRAGVRRLADLAETDSAALAGRLGPIARLIDLDAWIGFARRETGSYGPRPGPSADRLP